MKTEKMTLVSGIDTGETTGQAVELFDGEGFRQWDASSLPVLMDKTYGSAPPFRGRPQRGPMLISSPRALMMARFDPCRENSVLR